MSRGLAFFGTLLRELFFVVVALVAGIILVALLGFTAPTLADISDHFNPAPLLSTYLQTVGDYLAGLLRGDFGTTARGRPVLDVLRPAVQHSLVLLAASVAVAVPLGLGWGALLATVRQPFVATLLFGLSALAVALPTFLVLLLLTQTVATITMRTGVQLTYTFGYGLDRHLILPTAVLALRGAAYLARAVHVAQEEIAQQDWIRVARAKGLGGWQLWRRHMLPALALPLLGGLLGMLRVMVGGLLIVEFIYQWGGVGSLMLSVGQVGLRPTEGAVAAGAAGALVLFFILTDALGRLVAARLAARSGR